MARWRLSGRRFAPSGRIWPRLVLASLVVVAVGLSAVAFFLAIPDQSASSTPSSAPVPSTAAPTPTAAPKHPAPTRVLLALTSTGAWRAPIGSCPGAPITLEYTLDGGVTWLPSTSAGKLGATSVLDLERGLNGAIVAVGQAPDACAPQQYTTTSRSDKWKPADGVGTAWYVVPGAPSSINSPEGVRATPCGQINGLATGDELAVAVLCDDERFFRSTDHGATWDGGLSVPGAVSLGGNKQGYLIGAVGTPMCAGVQLEVFSPAMAPRDRAGAGCYRTAADTSQVALSVGAEVVWLWVGDETVALARNGNKWE
jgi:hypothetical protein